MVLALSAPSPASAQEQPLQAANGAAILLGSVEGALLLTMPIAIGILANTDMNLGEGMACLVLLPLCAIVQSPAMSNITAMLAVLLGSALVLVIPPIIAGVGGPNGWDADGSLVLTAGIHGLVEGLMLGGAIDVAAGGDNAIVAILTGLALGAGATTYAALRHTELTHDPRAGTEANLWMWGPPVMMGLTGLLMAAIEADAIVGLIVTGLVGLATQGLFIGLSELALSEPAPPVTMMLTEP